MITLNTFAEAIEKGLNSNAYGVKFKIFSDAGNFKKAVKTRTEKELYINGLLSVSDSSVLPAQNIKVVSQTAALEICVPLFNVNNDDEVISTCRNILDAYFSMFKVQSFPEGDKKYTVSALYSLAGTGSIEIRSGIGRSITFYVNIDYAYIENGLNSQNCSFTIDGVAIPYSSAKITKTPVNQSDAFSNSDGKGKGLNMSYVRGFDFQIPALSDPDGIGAKIIDNLVGDELNTIHTLVATLDGRVETFKVIVGSVDMVLEGIDNAGHNISFVEAVS